MIASVSIDGVAIDLDDVFASVTIRRGRKGVDDGPLSSSATLSLVNVTRAFASSFRVGSELAIDRTGPVARFRGHITDAELNGDTLAIVAISTLARLLKLPVGAVSWPAEAWSDRLERAFTEAGELATLSLLIAADEDPLVAARAADETTLGAVLDELTETLPASVSDLPDGRVMVQTLRYRGTTALVELDPDVVAFDLPWVQTDDVLNAVDVEWAGGAVHIEDLASIDRFELRPDTIETILTDEDDAEQRARREILRRAWPSWALDGVELLELTLVGVGARVLLADLPDEAPKETHIGIVEGFEDRIVAKDGELEWGMLLALSPAILSAAGVRWNEVDPALSWAEADSNWIETEELLYA